MNEKNEVFKKLLPIEKLFVLYQKLSETIITKIDLNNLNFDSISVNNSITLLCDVEMIQFHNKENAFQKNAKKNLDISEFIEILYARLRTSYPDAFLFIKESDLKYDEVEAMMYIKRNSVNLNLSGLLMLLDGIKKIKIRHNDIFILDKGLIDCRNNRSFNNKTLAELKNQLCINDEYGVEAELFAIEYEVEILKNAGISKIPMRISEYNTSAGYDIVSFIHTDSLTPDKFIEVKSCSDERWVFYISKNELEVAKRKQNSYYLYLYNRSSKRFRIIQNPFNFMLESDKKNEWIMEPQTYQVKSLERFT